MEFDNNKNVCLLFSALNSVLFVFLTMSIVQAEELKKSVPFFCLQSKDPYKNGKHTFFPQANLMC